MEILPALTRPSPVGRGAAPNIPASSPGSTRPIHCSNQILSPNPAMQWKSSPTPVHSGRSPCCARTISWVKFGAPKPVYKWILQEYW